MIIPLTYQEYLMQKKAGNLPLLRKVQRENPVVFRRYQILEADEMRRAAQKPTAPKQEGDFSLADFKRAAAKSSDDGGTALAKLYKQDPQRYMRFVSECKVGDEYPTK